MKIDELIERFTLDPKRDIVPFFQLKEKISENALHDRKCYMCKGEYNAHDYPSTAWTTVRICHKCNCINVIYWSDRMGGVYEDTIYIYVESDHRLGMLEQINNINTFIKANEDRNT